MSPQGLKPSTPGLITAARAWLRRLAEMTPAAQAQRRRMLAFYGQFIKSGDQVFDVGANIGNRTDVFLSLGARVVAVEPQPLCLKHLRRRFGKNPRVSLVDKALGAQAGRTEMHVSDADMISSLSADWIAKVRASGRFGGHRWDKTVTVDVTTLDALIQEFGSPVFCKIDVEGYEFEVLRGLSRSLAMISFEFTPEALEPALASIRRLTQLGPAEFNYSLGESMRWELDAWQAAETLIPRLQALPDPKAFGDVYARGRRK
jgi:FkbM family methyltransferase